MNVNETYKEELSCGFSVTIPYQDVEKAMGSEFEKMSAEVRLPGFRPGKVPKKILEQRFGSSVFSDVARRLISETMRQLIQDKNISPACEPRITVEALEQKKNIEYRLDIDLMPEILLQDFSKLTIELPIIDVPDADIDKMIENLTSQHAESEPIKEKRPVKKGDIVLIDFEGKVDGTPFDGGTAKEYKLELGAGNFLPDFEKALDGAEIGKDIKAPVVFPKNYQTKELAGKMAEFTIVIKEIHKKTPPVIDDDFAKKLGQSDVKALRDAVSKHIMREAVPVKDRIVRRQIFDLFEAGYDFNLPQRLVDDEFNTLWSHYQKSEQSNQKKPDVKAEQILRDDYKKMAERRIRIGFVLAAIGKKYNISVAEQELERALNQEASRYPGKEAQIIKHYRENPVQLENLRAPIFEDKVIALITEKTACNEKKMTPQEMMLFENEQNADEKTEAKPKTKQVASNIEGKKKKAITGGDEKKPVASKNKASS